MPTSFNGSVIEEFLANGGKVSGPFEGGNLLLLTTTGSKSKMERTIPLAYVRHGDAALLADIGIADPQRFRTELDGMSTELNAHLDYEEASLLPLLAEVPWPPAPPANTAEDANV